MVHIHVSSVGITPCDDPESQSVVSIGSEGLLFTGDTSWKLSRSHRCVVCLQLPSTNAFVPGQTGIFCFWDQRPRTILDLQGYHYLYSLTFAHLIITNIRSSSFLRLRCYPLQTSGFPLKTGGSPTTLLLQDVTVPPQIRCGVRFVFVVIFFYCSVYICTWNPGILYLHTRKDYTSAPFVIHIIHYLAITCRSRYFRVSFVFFGRFCRRLTL